MKKFLITLTVLSLFAGCANLSSQAVVQDIQERGFISVNTSANTEIAPDVAEISFTVKTSDLKSMQKASALNKEISDKVYTSLKSMLNTDNGDFIKTSDYNATPIYTYADSKKRLDKYEVSNRVIVHTKSLNKVGEIIDKATEAGATNVQNLVFSVSNYDKQCDELIGIATQKAYKRAGIIAKNLSTSIDGVKSLGTTCGANNYNAPRLYMAKNMALGSSADTMVESSSAPISEGVIKINANVNASFFVK